MPQRPKIIKNNSYSLFGDKLTVHEGLDFCSFIISLTNSSNFKLGSQSLGSFFLCFFIIERILSKLRAIFECSPTSCKIKIC